MSEILLAFLIDLFFGDPFWSWHPMRLMGKAIQRYEAWVHRLSLPLFGAGLVLALVLPFASWEVSRWVLMHLHRIGPHWHGWGLSTLLTIFLLYLCLAVRDLADHALVVVRALENGDLPAGRLAVARMVGRDTGELDETGVLRACLESVAESTCDGIVAPLFYASVGFTLFGPEGGAPLALAYKAVSTLDSMVGYRDERYARFGKASARLDDCLNWIPARLSVLLVSAAAWFLGLSGLRALETGFHDGASHPSPNSGWPEAAFAGALDVPLGGPSRYRGVLTEKPVLGGNGQATLDLQRVRWGIGLMLAASALAALLFSL
jgi:adenosylcobinamide-phosphate synthase